MKTLGVLVAGLRPNSRVAIEKSGEDFPVETMILAVIADTVRALVYGMSSKKKNKPPESIVEALRKKKPTVSEEMSFKSGADFDKARAEILKRLNNG